MDLPLNALRAFEVSARHLSFTRAGLELHLTQTAVSQRQKAGAAVGQTIVQAGAQDSPEQDEDNTHLPCW